MSLRRYSPFLAITSVVAACGGQPTQFSSPDSYRVAFSMTGSGVDRVQQLKQQAEQNGLDKVVIESGMSDAEKAAADAEVSKELADAIAAAGSASSSTPGSGSTPDAGGNTTSSTGSGGSSNTSTTTDNSGQTSNSGSVPSGSSSSSGSSGTSGSSGSTPYQVKPVSSLGQVAGNLGKFKASCAEVMSVDPSKVIGPMVSGSVARDEVLLIVVDKNGTLNIPLQGESMRGICIMSGQGGVVNIEGGSTKVGGVLTYQQGANNGAQIKFGANGKLDSAMATFSGSKNGVTFDGAKLASCSAPSVYKIGAGSVSCK